MSPNRIPPDLRPHYSRKMSKKILLGGINAQIYLRLEGDMIGKEGKKRLIMSLSQVMKVWDKMKEVVFLHQMINTLLFV